MKSIIKSKNLITPFASNKLKIFFKIKENDSVIKLFCYSFYIKEIIIQNDKKYKQDVFIYVIFRFNKENKNN